MTLSMRGGLTTLHTPDTCKEAHIEPTTHRYCPSGALEWRPQKLSVARGDLTMLAVTKGGPTVGSGAPACKGA